ncbi:MAG: sulfatase-like hydrolase/transferase [Spirochaetia bacterium]|nr:sulfatase-like hydrolase/transferase [Spirochaetia bacterium]
MREHRPNIVFIMADQLAASFVGCYGSGVASTPNIDALAARGSRFDRFYAHCPVCAPNRATIYTGRSIEVHGMTTNNLHLDTSFPTYVQVLKEQGYVTGGFGKFHQTPMQQPLPEDFSHLGYDVSVATEDPKLGPWLDWIKQTHPDYYEQALSVSWPMAYCSSYGSEGEDITGALAAARERYLKPLQDRSSWHHMYRSPLPKELHQTTWITDNGIRFIKDHSDQPFLCHLSYVDPHDPYDPPVPYDTMFSPQDMKLPVPMAVRRYKTEILNDVMDFAGFSALSDDEQAVRTLRALYHGSIRFIDDQIGRLVGTLEELGVLEHTVIVFTTDHGDMMGDHGFMTKGVKHYDAGIRCPLVISGKGIESGKIITELCSSLDIYPTLTDIGRCESIPPVEGASLLPLAGSSSCSYGEQDILVQSPYNTEGHVDTLITPEGWRLSVYDDGCMQLFDLRNDPEEQEDLADREDTQKVLVSLLGRLVMVKSRAGTVQQYGVLPISDGLRCMVEHDLGPMTPVWTTELDTTK